MCESGEFDVEEEVGRWSTDGRWMVSAPPQHQDRSLLKLLLGTVLLLLESASRVLLGNAVGALPSFQFKCVMLRADWWAGYSGTAGSLVEEDPGGRLGRSWQSLSRTRVLPGTRMACAPILSPACPSLYSAPTYSPFSSLQSLPLSCLPSPLLTSY